MGSQQKTPFIEISVSPDQPSMLLAAPSVIVTAFSPGEGSVPTLMSVENVVGELAKFGLVLQEGREVEKIAHLVNKHFLQRPQVEWKNCFLSLETIATTGEMVPALGVVQGIRSATLESATEILHQRRYGDPISAHRAEDALVTSLETVTRKEKSLFESRGSWVPRLIARTALSSLVSGLVGIPLEAVIHAAIGGLFKGVASS